MQRRLPPAKRHQTSNQRITELAALLPVTDWGKAHEIEITETDPLTGKQHYPALRRRRVGIA